MIIVKPIVFYKEFGEDSEFFNDCLATQKELQKSGRSGPRFLSLMKIQKGPKNETIVEELEKSGRSGPRFLILMKNQKGPKNQTIVEELEKRTRGPLNPYRLYVHMEIQNGSKDETSLRELEGRAWSAPEPNVMYRVHCTVQYHAGAIDEDTDDDERPEKDLPSCAGFPAVTSKVDAGKNEMENRDTDAGTDKNQMADVLKTKVNDRDCIGTHLTPHLRHYSNMLDESQTEDYSYEVEGDDFSYEGDFEHTHGFYPGAREDPSDLDVTSKLLTPASDQLGRAVGRQLTPASSQLSSAVSRQPGLEQSIPRREGQDIA